MSTRSRIGIKRTDGSIKMIYCHSDGYFSHNGRVLLAHHDTLKHAEALVSQGDMSVLGEVIGTKHDFDWIMNFPDNAQGHIDWDGVRADPRNKMCRFYMRDRGEKGLKAEVYPSLAAASGAFEEYLYLWDIARGCWIATATCYEDVAELKWFALADLKDAGFLVEGNHDDPSDSGTPSIDYDLFPASALPDADETKMNTVLEGLHSF